jgi:hypothetical protein
MDAASAPPPCARRGRSFVSARRPRRVVALIAFALAALAGCVSIQTDSEVLADVDFAAYRSFALARAPSVPAAGLPGYDESSGDRINTDIAANLEARGLRRVDREEADLWVTFTVDGRPRTDVAWVGGGLGLEGSSYPVTYTLGLLVIEVFDARDRRPVWRGWGQAMLQDEREAARRRPQVVEAILDEFPTGR